MGAKDPYRYFRIEAKELLDQLARGVIELEKAGAEPERVTRLLRLAHTLKGAARVVKLREIADLAHGLEDVLTPYRDAGRALTRDTVDRILAGLDAISERMARLPLPPGETSAAGVASPPGMVRADVAVLDTLLEGIGEIHGELATLSRTARSAEQARHVAGSLAAHLEAANRAGSADNARHLAALTKAQPLLEEVYGALASVERTVTESIGRIQRELRQARELTEGLRLVNASSLFGTLERTVRDAAQGAAKRVHFESSGAEVRLDGQILADLQGALIQLMRNAVAHGIEPEAQRRSRGKPEEGMVSLEVSRRGQRVSFRCRDDGRGVDLEAVRAVAEQKGLLSGGATATDPEQLLRILLQGGITTRAAVTELAGRGIGLDVVREAVERCGGDVLVSTVAGEGTTIEIQVPVSLASLEALVVESHGQLAAIPLDAVRGAVRIAPDSLAVTPEGDAVQYAGRLLPLIPLALYVPDPPGADSTPTPQGPVSAVVVNAGGASVALSVDGLRGTETVVQRPLPASAPAEPAIAGVYFDAEGNPRLILDPAVLVAGPRHTDVEPATEFREAPRILIVDDSVTTRMLEQSILESAGYRTEQAASAEEALRMAAKDHFGLFLVDVEMPGMDGFEFVDRIQADGALRGVPCVLVTSRDSAADRRRGEQSGARAYIVKSEFDQTGFLQCIAGLVVQ